MKTITEKQLVTALKRAIRNINDSPVCMSAASSAGFVFPTRQRRGDRHGFQIFVKICRYSDRRLKEKPESGGLADNQP